MRNEDVLILGGGITGLSAGVRTGKQIYEAKDTPGGICKSYYVTPDGKKSEFRNNDESYRFEMGGGHWIFGADDGVLDFIDKLSPVRSYERRSAVYFPDLDLYVPYPLQNHLSHLPMGVARKALDEITNSDHAGEPSSLAGWLELHFGKTLCELFFFPFHQSYTAGLFTEIEPQDKYKTPVDRQQIIDGFKGRTKPVGYNARFVYPQKGLDDLMRNMAGQCRVAYQKEVTRIDAGRKEILFGDGTGAKYKTIISTLPLNRAVELAGISVQEREPPYTSVLVVNVGAERGSKCPDYHWLYIPKSNAGFHFLPRSSRKDNNRVCIYVEKAYLPGERPDDEQIKRLCNEVTEKLQGWEFIGEPEVIDPTWVEVAYTWSYPGSNWREKALRLLRERGINQIGRYGLWRFQGIAESIEDGLQIRCGE